ncbi:MAG TPA: hypothetical protein VI542_33115 [Candidatus Tectomicrobia bacterium]
MLLGCLGTGAVLGLSVVGLQLYVEARSAQRQHNAFLDSETYWEHIAAQERRIVRLDHKLWLRAMGEKDWYRM